jgi:hypothetical protein
MKILVAIGLIAVLACLGTALYFMLGSRQDGDGRRGRLMARALAFRIGLSVLLFIVILVAYTLGYIQPTGLPAGR